MTRIRIPSLLSLLAVASLSCGGEEPEGPWTSPVPFDTAGAWVEGPEGDSVPLLVELARSSQQQRFGMMERPALDPGSGMVFQYDSVQSHGFWMFRVRFPLDIAFLDSAGVVLRVLGMEPCESELYPEACPIYEPGVEYWSALEVSRGWFEAHGLGPGAEVRLDTAAAGAP